MPLGLGKRKHNASNSRGAHSEPSKHKKHRRKQSRSSATSSSTPLRTAPDRNEGSGATASETASSSTAANKMISQAIADFRMPAIYQKDGYVISKKPPPTKSRSLIWDVGVRIEKDDDPQQIRWFCLASENCREKLKNVSQFDPTFALTPSSSSNAMKHIKSVHSHLVSIKTMVTTANKDALQEELSAVRASAMQSDDERRFSTIAHARLIIAKLLPFNFFEDPESKLFVQTIGGADNVLASVPVYAKKVRHTILELYEGTRLKLASKINKGIKDADIPNVYLNVDLWTSDVCQKKFLGVRVFFVDQKWELQSYLLAVRLFEPTCSDYERERLSDLLYGWVCDVLEEFELTIEDVAGSTSDGGSDIKRMMKKLISDSLWEWCVPHMTNRVLQDACGTSLDPQGSKNVECRELVVKMKKVIEFFQKSSQGKKLLNEVQAEDSVGKVVKLISHAPHRFLSLARVVERFLELWDSIVEVYRKKEKEYPLHYKRDDYLQLHALLDPIADLMRDTQAQHYPTGVTCLLGLVTLQLSTLDPTSPLPVRQVGMKATRAPEIISVDESGGAAITRGDSTGTVKQAVKQVAHESLSRVIKDTRVKIKHEFSKRFFCRYSPDCFASPTASTNSTHKKQATETYSYVFELACALTPKTSALLVIDKVVGTLDLHLEPHSFTQEEIEGHAETIKKFVWKKIRQMAVQVAEKSIAKKLIATPATTAGTLIFQSSSTTTSGTYCRAQKVSTLHSGMGFFNTSKTCEEEIPLAMTSSASVRQKAERAVDAEIEIYLNMTNPSSKNVTDHLERPAEDVLIFWKDNEHKLPYLSSVARSIFGAPASAAAIERDFGIAGLLLTSRRSRLEGIMVEMVLFLNMNKAIVPWHDVAAISKEDFAKKIPSRYKKTVANLAIDVVESASNELADRGALSSDDEDLLGSINRRQEAAIMMGVDELLLLEQAQEQTSEQILLDRVFGSTDIGAESGGGGSDLDNT